MDNKGGKYAMKWFITVIASGMFVYSSVVRVEMGLEADKSLCAVFAFVAGLPWGANIMEYFKKLK